jgi:hypothetical protein
MSHLSTSGPSRIIFERLWDYFHLEDLASGFPLLFQLCYHIAQDHIPCQITHVLGTTYLLAMTKPLGGVRPITMGETLYQLTSRILHLQFHNVFITHFSPHQFKVITKCGREAIIHSIKCTLNLHPNWVVFQLNITNAFNLMSRGVLRVLL